MPQTDEAPKVLPDQHEDDPYADEEAWKKLIASLGSLRTRYDFDMLDFCREERRVKYE